MRVPQNGVMVQRNSVEGAFAEHGGLALAHGAGTTNPERACIGSGLVTDCGTFTPIAPQASTMQFNHGTHALLGANVEITADDGLTPNTGAFNPAATYNPTVLFRAMSLSGAKSVQVGTDAGPKVTVDANGVEITGGFNGKALCQKSNGKVGFCSTAVDASGNCTCN